MFFEEPKVEFVNIEMTDIVVTSSGSVETCNGPDAPGNNCSTMMSGGFMRN